MSNPLEDTINKIIMHKKIIDDLTSGKYFSGTDFEVFVFRNATNDSRGPDYAVQISSSTLAKALMELLVTVSQDSIEITRRTTESQVKAYQKALDTYKKISSDAKHIKDFGTDKKETT